MIAPVVRAVRRYHPDEDIQVLQRAYEVANRCHEGQKRKSGDPYITHPVAVTAILAEMGATGPVLAAGLLHDTVEDTDYTMEQLTEEFGEEVAYLVDGVTKLDKMTYGENASIETIRQARAVHEQGHSRAAHQACRPPAQRPHLAFCAAGFCREEGGRDPEDLRAARAPPGLEHD